MNCTNVNPNVIPNFFRDLKVICPASEQAAKLRAENSKSSLAKEDVKIDVSSDKSPYFMMTEAVKKIYTQGDFSALSTLEKKAQNDVQAIYDNIAKHKDQAWTLVESGGVQFYMSWSDTGSIWCYPESIKQVQIGDKPSTQICCQVGTYSANTNICGIQRMNFTVTNAVGALVIALILAIALADIFAAGLGFMVTALALTLANAAAALGFESFSFVVSAGAVANVALILAAVILFIGLMYLWDFLNRKFTVRVQIFNWDKDSSWSCVDTYHKNTKIAGETDEGFHKTRFSIPKVSKDQVTPPGFDPVIPLEEVCYYAVIVLENDSTFMQGCSAALAMKRGDTDTGFTWAFDLPRMVDNKHGAVGQIQKAESFYKSGSWSSNPKNFAIKADSTPIKLSLNALSGAKDNLYEIIININQS